MPYSQAAAAPDRLAETSQPAVSSRDNLSSDGVSCCRTFAIDYINQFTIGLWGQAALFPDKTRSAPPHWQQASRQGPLHSSAQLVLLDLPLINLTHQRSMRRASKEKTCSVLTNHSQCHSANGSSRSRVYSRSKQTRVPYIVGNKIKG